MMERSRPICYFKTIGERRAAKGDKCKIIVYNVCVGWSRGLLDDA